jgi:hypothetical protein
MMAALPILPICVIAFVQPLTVRLGSGARTVGAIVAAAMVAGHAAQVLSVWMVKPQERELALVRPAIAAATGGPSLTVVPATDSDTLAPGVDHDEFGTVSSSKRWVILPLTELVYFEAHGQWYGHTFIAAREDPQPGTAVLDFAQVLKK